MADEREVRRKARDMAWREPIDVDELWGELFMEEAGMSAVLLEDCGVALLLSPFAAGAVASRGTFVGIGMGWSV